MVTKVFPLTEEDRRVLHSIVSQITQLKKDLAAHKESLQRWLDSRTGTTFKGTQDRRWTPDYQYLVVNEREPSLVESASTKADEQWEIAQAEKEKGNETRNQNQKV